MVIWVIKVFFVEFFCIFFHLLLSSASVRSLPFLSFILPIFAWNILLVSLIFLKKSLVFPIYCFLLIFPKSLAVFISPECGTKSGNFTSRQAWRMSLLALRPQLRQEQKGWRAGLRDKEVKPMGPSDWQKLWRWGLRIIPGCLVLKVWYSPAQKRQKA